MRISATWVASIAICSLAVFSNEALAQTARSGSNANAQLMQQMQQLAGERTALQAENARMKRELAEVTKQRDALQSGRTAADTRTKQSEVALAQSKRDKESVEHELAALKERTQE